MDILRNEGYFRKKYYQDTKKKNQKKRLKRRSPGYLKEQEVDID